MEMGGIHTERLTIWENLKRWGAQRNEENTVNQKLSAELFAYLLEMMCDRRVRYLSRK